MKLINVILIVTSLSYSQSSYDVLRPFFGFDDSQTSTSSIGSATVACGNLISGHTSNPANIGLNKFTSFQINFVNNKFINNSSIVTSDNIGVLNFTYPFPTYRGSLSVGFSAIKERDFSSSAKIKSGPKAPGAAEKIDVFFSYPENLSRYLETNKTLKIM